MRRREEKLQKLNLTPLIGWVLGHSLSAFSFPDSRAWRGPRDSCKWRTGSQTGRARHVSKLLQSSLKSQDPEDSYFRIVLSSWVPDIWVLCFLMWGCCSKTGQRTTNVQQLTCKRVWSFSSYSLFILLRKGLILRESPGGKKCEKVWKSVKKVPKRFCPLVVAL